MSGIIHINKPVRTWQPLASGGNIAWMLSPEDETRAVTEVAQRLSVTFPDVAADVVKDTVHESHERFSGSPIRDFVPVLVERMAKTTLVNRSALT